MLAGLRRRLTYANVVSTICLCLVVGGGSAYAANTIFSSDIVDGEVKTPDLASGAVTAGKLKPGAVTTDKLAGGAVTTDKVKDNNLGGRDVLDNSLRGVDIDESTLTNIGGGGPAGGDLTGTYPNPEIAQGAVGKPEIAGEAVGAGELEFPLTFGHLIEVSSGGVGEVVATCPAGYIRLSGGAQFQFPSGDISESRPGLGESWVAEGQNNGNLSQALTAWISCLSP